MAPGAPAAPPGVAEADPAAMRERDWGEPCAAEGPGAAVLLRGVIMTCGQEAGVEAGEGSCVPPSSFWAVRECCTALSASFSPEHSSTTCSSRLISPSCWIMWPTRSVRARAGAGGEACRWAAGVGQPVSLGKHVKGYILEAWCVHALGPGLTLLTPWWLKITYRGGGSGGGVGRDTATRGGREGR